MYSLRAEAMCGERSTFVRLSQNDSVRVDLLDVFLWASRFGFSMNSSPRPAELVQALCKDLATVSNLLLKKKLLVADSKTACKTVTSKLVELWDGFFAPFLAGALQALPPITAAAVQLLLASRKLSVSEWPTLVSDLAAVFLGSLTDEMSGRILRAVTHTALWNAVINPSPLDSDDDDEGELQDAFMGFWREDIQDPRKFFL
jgi:hypothetical protein